jgi:hypothetical protein
MTVLVAANSASPAGFEEITQAPSFLARYLRLKHRGMITLLIMESLFYRHPCTGFCAISEILGDK